MEFLSGRFGPHFKKSPDWYRLVAAQSVERCFFTPGIPAPNSRKASPCSVAVTVTDMTALPECECGAFAMGRCASCERYVCAQHSFHDEQLLCHPCYERL